jgi:hypothetical protein
MAIESFNKDKAVYKILGGFTKIKIGSDVFLIHSPTPYIKYLAEELYEELLDNYASELLSDEELYDWLIHKEYWSYDNDTKVKDFKKNIEKLQVGLFECAFKSKERKEIKKSIAFTRGRLRELHDARHKYDNLSATGVASIAKHKYIIGLSVCNQNKIPLFNEFDFLSAPFPLLDRIIVEYNRNLLSSPQFRLIARSEPWRQYWTAKDGTAGLFGGAGIELTDEQLTLISWTKLYDNVFQHPKCPNDSVIEDDDALDGFLIKDKQERDKDKDGQAVDDILSNPRIKNADEVFIPVETEEDAAKIEQMNSEMAKSIKRQRQKHIDKYGKSDDMYLPDVRQRLQLEMNQSSMAAAKARMQMGN